MQLQSHSESTRTETQNSLYILIENIAAVYNWRFKFLHSNLHFTHMSATASSYLVLSSRNLFSVIQTAIQNKTLFLESPDSGLRATVGGIQFAHSP